MTTRWLRQDSLKTVMKARGMNPSRANVHAQKLFHSSTVSAVLSFRKLRKVLGVPTTMVGKQINTMGWEWTWNPRMTGDARSIHLAVAELTSSRGARWSGSLVMLWKNKAQKALSYRPVKDV